ncbi:MAG: hypothetical protein Q4B73_02210 [Lachnospiraceae bacterium]|nr:hypothetical protein [Lachnospiraceae bacterium]
MNKKKSIFGNTIYTIAGALVLNGVLQLIIFPRLTAEMGAEAIGAVLYITGLVSILGPSIGQALNTGRLVVRRDHDVSNGDYDCTILLFSAIGIAAALIFSRASLAGALTYLLTALLLLVTIFRYYGDAEYRLSLNYKRYFIYYLLISLGYLVGYGLYRLGGSWFFIFLIGEAAALVYVSVTGGIFRQFFRRSPNFSLVLGKGAILVASYFVTNTTLNIDRLVLNNTLGGTAVTHYYVVSLIGKTLVLFIAPINTILISYLTKDKVRIDRKSFMKYAGIGLLVAAVFFALCQIGTPIFIRLFYAELYQDVLPYVTVVNLTQILSMLSAYLFIIVLTFTSEKWQLGLQCAHFVIVLLLIFAMMGGTLMGFSNAVLIANALRILAVLVLGLVMAGRQKTN